MPDSRDSMAVLITAANEFDAGVIVAALEAEDVEARVVHESLGLLGMQAPAPNSGALVVVRETDLERAREVLRRVRAESVDIDWSEIGGVDDDEAPPPVTHTTTSLMMLLVSAALLLALVVFAPIEFAVTFIATLTLIFLAMRFHRRLKRRTPDDT